MKRVTSLSDLLMEELADLLNAEDQLTGALPRILQASQSSALRILLEDHSGVTKNQAGRLQDIFNTIGHDPGGEICEDMKGFIAEIEGVVKKTQKGAARDAAIISIAQRVEQYQISGYQEAREHAADLGHTRIVELLTEALNEERSMNFHLNELAQYMINVQATNPFDPYQRGFYIPEGKFSRKDIKKKTKDTDVSRFISEGNPNIQEPPGKDEEK